MSAKISKIYTCSKCGAQTAKWQGRCAECGTWGTVQEDILDSKSLDKKISEAPSADLINLSSFSNENVDRLETGISEFDRVLGGGLIPGSLVLIGGEPGIGKSTLLAQICGTSHQKNLKSKIVYVSGEESAGQVKSRFDRLRVNLDGLKFVNETNVEKILNALKKYEPDLLILDSVQTVHISGLESEPGSVSQIRAVTSYFMEFTKKRKMSTILVGHITKDGAVAGPKTLEHMVDTVLYLEMDKSQNYRLLRSTKNRFGSTQELGVFEMKKEGLSEVKNSSAIFLEDSQSTGSGSITSVVMDGTRSFVVEVQALVSKTIFGYPQRKSSGLDLNRLQVLTAVLSKRSSVDLLNQDVILNIVGGLKVLDTALDLAICMSIMSSYFDKSIPNDTIVLGEVGLSGEVRNVSGLEKRLKEAQKLGFTKAITPNTKINFKGLELRKIKNISEIIFDK